MQKVTREAASRAKKEFSDALQGFVSRMQNFVSTDHGEWTVKGFIDIYRNIYTISIDTKIISKILEIHLFPQILQLAEEQRYSIVLAEHQNWYPDLSFVNQSDPRIRFAVDLKTTYRDPKFPGHVNGFTLGSHGAYFRDRTSSKNIQFPYGTYLGHFCLGIIYSRASRRKEERSILPDANHSSTDKEPGNQDETGTLDQGADPENKRSLDRTVHGDWSCRFQFRIRASCTWRCKSPCHPVLQGHSNGGADSIPCQGIS